MTESISAEDFNELMAAEGKKKRRKYNNTIVEYDGHTFDSIKECERYKELRLLEQAGEIADLELQPKYPLLGKNGTKIAEYWADFSYFSSDAGAIVIEDVKSPITRQDKVYRIKKKLMEDNYQIKLHEV